MRRGIIKPLFFFLSFCIIISGWGVSNVYGQTNTQVLIPNDPHYFRQWYLPHVQLPQAWTQSTGDREIVVAVLDTGVDITHEDLKNSIWINRGEKPYDQIDNDGNGYVDDFYGWNFVDDSNVVEPLAGNASQLPLNHGTIVAGVIGAQGNNEIGITGVSWNVSIMPLTVLAADGRGDSRAVTQAIHYAINKGADVINLSFVGDTWSRELQEAIQRAYDHEIVVVAAAGNEAESGLNLNTTPAYPVCNDGTENIVLGVAAVDQQDNLVPFSNHGKKCIDVAAPGSNFFSTVVSDMEGQPYMGGWSGTSVAAPMVSGLAALIKAINPQLRAVHIRNIIINTAKNIDAQNSQYPAGAVGAGLIQADAALDAAVATLGAAAVHRSGNTDMILVGPQIGGGPHVRLLDAQANALGQWFAYAENFRGGVSVAAGDIDGDGKAEVITGAGPGGGPHVRVFDSSGLVKDQFMAYNQQFQGGIRVAIGDVDTNPGFEIVTVPYSAGGPHVRVFESSGALVSQWFAGDVSYRGGLTVAIGSPLSGQLQNIIIGSGPGQAPMIMIYDWLGNIQSSFPAYNSVFRGGVNVAILPL